MADVVLRRSSISPVRLIRNRLAVNAMSMLCEPEKAGALSIPAFRNKRPAVPVRIARPPKVPVRTGQDKKV